MRIFEGTTADEVWQQALTALHEGGDTHFQASRAGLTKELLHAEFVVHDPRQRWAVSRLPPINPAFAIAEVIWLLRGRNDAAFLNFWNSKLPNFAGKSTAYHGAYGYRLRNHFGLDQLERAFVALSNNPESRQVALQIWDPQIDLPDEQGQPVSPDVPCNVVALLKVRRGRLEWMQVMRSNDIFRGTPYNLIQFTSMQEVVAGWLGLEPGTYHQISDSLHLYETDEEVAVDDSVRTEPNTDSLCLAKEQSEAAIAQMSNYVDALIGPNLTELDLEGIVKRSRLPQAFENMLFILASEAARRRGWTDAVRQSMQNCTNPLLVQIWTRWLQLHSVK